MSDAVPQSRAPKTMSGRLPGVAGCGITFMVTAIGALLVGWIGWMTSPLQQHLNEYIGRQEVIETLIHLAKGLIGGGVTGFVAGVVFAEMHVRQVKAATKIGDESHE